MARTFDFDELVALRLETMRKRDALTLAIAHLSNSALIDVEAARRLLIIIRNQHLGGNHDDITEANVPYV